MTIQFVRKDGLVHVVRFRTSLDRQTVMFPNCAYHMNVGITWSDAKVLAEGCESAGGPPTCFRCLLQGE